MSSKKFNMEWPPERTVKLQGVLKSFKNRETMDIATETSYRVNQSEQADTRGV